MLSRTKFQMNRTFFTQTFSKVSSETNPVQEFRIKTYETYVKSFFVCSSINTEKQKKKKKTKKHRQLQSFLRYKQTGKLLITFNTSICIKKTLVLPACYKINKNLHSQPLQRSKVRLLNLLSNQHLFLFVKCRQLKIHCRKTMGGCYNLILHIVVMIHENKN